MIQFLQYGPRFVLSTDAWIRLAMEFFEPEDREVLGLRQREKRSLAEIGEKFGISEKAVWMRHNRAVKRLGKKIWDLRL